MTDDVSIIPTTGCNVISDSDFISNYNGRIKKDYISVNGKWYLYRTSTSIYNDYDISPYNCIDVSTLNSNAVFVPFLYGLAFMLFAFVVVLFYKTIKGFIHGI